MCNGFRIDTIGEEAVIRANVVRLAQGGSQWRKIRNAPEALVAGTDKLEIALAAQPVVKTEDGVCILGIARAYAQHILDDHFVGKWLLLLFDVLADVADITAAEAMGAICGHPAAAKEGDMGV